MFGLGACSEFEANGGFLETYKWAFDTCGKLLGICVKFVCCDGGVVMEVLDVSSTLGLTQTNNAHQSEVLVRRRLCCGDGSRGERTKLNLLRRA